MNPPPKLYRYRSLNDKILDRELSALRESYLFSPSFGDMNDPMEGFYEIGGLEQTIVNAVFPAISEKLREFYKIFADTIARFALISFSGIHDDLPLWAYYASNFAGICLEFDTEALAIGDLQHEKLRQVTYARTALPPLTFADMERERLEDAVIGRIIRKRIEWAHEKEWRYLTGKVGQKYYPDDALTRVFLGPRIGPAHAKCICDVLDRRLTEVLQGRINGYELEFRTLKPSRALEECERVGAGKFDPVEDLYAEKELREFLAVPFEALIEQCRRTALRPNMDAMAGVDLAGTHADAIYFSAKFKLRNGRYVWHKRYFDQHLRPVLRPT